MESTSVASKHGLVLPSELVLFFKSIVALEGMGRMILPDFDFLSYSLDFAKDLVFVKVEPRRLFSDASVAARDLNSLLQFLPRQIKQALRRINDPDFSVQIRSKDLESLQRSIEKGSWIIFSGLVAAALILALFRR
jgi:ubiquinone biosynthesis protein